MSHSDLYLLRKKQSILLKMNLERQHKLVASVKHFSLRDQFFLSGGECC